MFGPERVVVLLHGLFGQGARGIEFAGDA